MAQLVGWYVPNPEAGVYSVIPQFSLSSFEAPKMFQFDFGFIAKECSCIYTYRIHILVHRYF